MIRRLVITLTIAAAAAAGSTGSAVASSEPFGHHVAECAHMSLGQRDNPPSVTCTDDGVTMTFANFGEMVQHMRSDR